MPEVTGASSGFGRHLTELVLQHGDIAIATLRTPSALADLATYYSPNKLLVLRLDVTKPHEISDAFARACSAFGRVDVVFNNAGYGVMSEVEGAPDDTVRAMFEVNFWGAVNVSREAVRIFREVNAPPGGRLLQVSSAGGIQGFSALGFYSASKFAIEGISEALAAELRPEWNIKVSIFELGAFRTNAGKNMVRTAPHPAYIDPEKRLAIARAYLQVNPPMPSDTSKGTRAIYALAAMAEPPLHVPLGKDAVKVVKAKAETLAQCAEDCAPWSERLELAPGEGARL
ncbi:NAD(P)-binding protein [Laetiporus sulphureus 93-53]|uniref:NAD(P)-binding protein n=1 Tax=Laetiporus sulphureus 93-53 TaxID=1314785 RepID=A0A165DDH7_9APHY|nr:NAD(P)-binding protein [Laetiporus sulphureus 93-53]KZT04633.1 NAD(P)-binding protein [Laetiporus sulphureus 93-53]